LHRAAACPRLCAGVNGAHRRVMLIDPPVSYISVDRDDDERDCRACRPGTALVCTFVLPVDLIDPDERELRALTEERAAARGAPWISFYSRSNSFRSRSLPSSRRCAHVSASELNERYVAARPDRLRFASGAL